METNTFLKTITAVGFVAIGIGILVARGDPATGFEMSIYAGTPNLFWACVCAALFASVLIVFANPNRKVLATAAVLAGTAMTAIVSVPIIRGYHYVGRADSLSHLGTAIDLNAGLLPMTESRYPAVHTIGSVLHDATGLAITHVLLLVVVIYILAFFLFIPLTIRQLTGNTTMTYIGLFAGLLLLPINHLSPSMYIHPTSQALMYAPVPLFAFFSMYRTRTWRSSGLFLLTAVALILTHPQQAANLLAFGVFIAVFQVGADLYRGVGLGRLTEWVLPEVTVFAIAFWLWVRRLEAFWDNLESVYMIPFTETTPAASTVSRSYSLAEVGGSLPEVFLKLFFVSTLFALLTVCAAVLEFYRQRGHIRSESAVDAVSPDGGSVRTNLAYVFAGLTAIGGIFLVYLVGGISDQYFRQLGMLMVLASILGSIALGRGLTAIATRRSASAGRWAVGGFLIFCLALSMPVVFSSPYIYDGSNHVSETQMDGYETAFTYQSDSIAFDNVRSKTHRYGHAVQGRDIPTEAYYDRAMPGIPDHFNDRALPAVYEDPTYVPVTEMDRTLDPVLWEGFRFSHEDFQYLETDPEINRVQSNGGYDLYLVN